MNRALFLVLLALAGCEDHLPLVGAPCPCAAGTVCDPGTSRCVLAGAGAPDGAADSPDGVADSPDAAADAAIEPPDAPALRPDVIEPVSAPVDGLQYPGQGACKSLSIATVNEFETKFIVPRCGTARCHGPMSVFPPRNLDIPSMIRPNLVGKKSALNCKNDFYVDTTNPWKSVMLSTVWPVTDTVICPSGGQGGTRMPNKPDMPTIVGERLTQAELECFTWWVFEIARL
jgi:hypothetical protein